jgi:hypothetical protein
MLTEYEKAEFLEKDLWSDIEIAFLLQGVYPGNLEKSISCKEDIEEITRKIKNIFNDISIAKSSGNLFIISKINTGNRVSVLFRPKEVIKWAENKPNTYPDFPFTLSDIEKAAKYEESKCKINFGAYSTKELELLAKAVKKFWSLYDPSDKTTAPLNRQVSDWLEENGMSGRAAKIAAQIIRADGLRGGRR